MPRNKVMNTNNTEEELVNMGMGRRTAKKIVDKSQRYKKAVELIAKLIEKNIEKGRNEKKQN